MVSCLQERPIKDISKLIHDILGVIDYERVCRIRNENYAYLESKLGRLNKLNLTTPKGAFLHLFYVENEREIRKALVLKKKINIPTLWSNVLNNTLEVCFECKFVDMIMIAILKEEFCK